MAWFFGILFFATAALWILRERRSRHALEEVKAVLAELAHARDVTGSSRHGSLPEIAASMAAVRAGLEDLQRLRQLAEANLEIILSSMQEGVLVSDSRRTVRLMNPAARRLFPVPADVLGIPVLDALREPEVDAMIAEALRSGTSQEHEIEAGGRPPLVLATRVAPMRDAAGDLGALVMFRDVTRLTSLEKVRREFVANVSHELRTPLAIFQGYVETLQDSPEMSRSEQSGVFAILAKHSARLNALVEDLLVLARLEARTDELEIAPLDVGEFFQELRRDWANRMDVRGVTMRLDLVGDLPVIHADRMRLEQVCTNLLDNGLKYTPAGGEITLGAARHGDMVELWVSDTGQGILSADLPHIFERFYRADKARSREFGGTGLGLSIVKHIAQAHGGSVSAESAYGSGTTIRVRIPVRPLTH